ncbi:MAG: outer membrane lipoprotein carrier protein LolA [Desulfobacterium sp.]|nr:outer membrane lipoprotein carrier protein LolA [Desulfobacterium sp.]
MIIRKMVVFLFWVLSVMPVQAVFSQDSGKPSEGITQEQERVVNGILDCVEKRYSGRGFSARFFQTSTLQAMKITDSANGQAFFKKPGMMKWEYIKPDRQQIITDGTSLWIYRPDDKQVTVGTFPSFFSNGKGAGFLSDISLIRKKFIVTIGDSLVASENMLKLWPREKNIDISVIQLSISAETCNVIRVVTYNAYGDETRIELTDIDFSDSQPDSTFQFTIPPGTDIVRMDQ